jgi:hypothetical protein
VPRNSLRVSFGVSSGTSSFGSPVKSAVSAGGGRFGVRGLPVGIRCLRSGDMDRSCSDEVARTLTGVDEGETVGEGGRFLEGGDEAGISDGLAYELDRGMRGARTGDGDPEDNSSGGMVILISCWR